MNARPQIFISATSADLGAARDLAAKALSSLGYTPIWEDIFDTDGGDLRQILRDKIDSCQLVLQLLGHRYGAEPRAIDSQFGRVSYTQFEARYARQRGITVIYLFLDRAYPIRDCPTESDDRRALQSAYRQSIRDGDQLHHGTFGGRQGFATPVELENQVLKIRLQPAPATSGHHGIPWSTPPRAPGFAGRVADLVQVTDLLKNERCIALTGPGGMGKTALAAEAIFQLAPAPGPQSRWPGGIYIHDYYRESSHPSALTGLLGQAGIDIRQVTDATGEVRRLFSQPGVLLYLEGCEKAEALTALLDLTGCSQVLLTTRDKHQRGTAHPFEIPPLDEKSAAQLLHYHARHTELPDRPANPSTATPPNPAASDLPRPVRHERGEGRGEGQSPSLLPRPMRHEWGEGRGEGSPQPGRPTSPQPSPPAAGGEGDRAPGLSQLPPLLPRPMRHEWGEGRGEGSPPPGRPTSPQPSPPAAGGEGDGSPGFSVPQLQSPDREHPAWVPWLKLARELGGHPLALRLAGAWMHDQQESPEEFAVSQATEQFGDWTQRDQRKDNLHRLFGHSADAVARKHPLALEVWYALALHGHAPVPLSVLYTCVKQPEADVRKALAALVNYSLAERGEFPEDRFGKTEPAWQLTHGLLEEWGRNGLGILEPLSGETTGHLHCFLFVRPQRGESRREGLAEPAERSISPQPALPSAGGEGEPRHLASGRCEAIFDRWRMWWDWHLREWNQMDSRFGGPAQYLAAQPHWESLLRLVGQCWGEESRELARMLERVARPHWSMGNLVLAEPLFRREMAINERLLGDNDLLMCNRLNSLAGLLKAKGDLAGAEPLLRRVLEDSERSNGGDHRFTLHSLEQLALLLRIKGDLAGAEPLYRRALEDEERVLGVEGTARLPSVINLAELLWAKGDLDGAERLYRRAMDGYERELHLHHRETLNSINNLVLLLVAKSDLTGAESLLRQALEATEYWLASAYSYGHTCVTSLTALLRVGGDLVRAEPLLRRALDVSEVRLGARHPYTLTSVNNLATLLEANGDLAGAEPLRRRTLAVLERAQRVNHPHRCLSQYNLARLLQTKGEFQEAEALARRAHLGLLADHGLAHYRTIMARRRLNLIIAKSPLKLSDWPISECGDSLRGRWCFEEQ